MYENETVQVFLYSLKFQLYLFFQHRSYQVSSLNLSHGQKLYLSYTIISSVFENHSLCLFALVFSLEHVVCLVLRRLIIALNRLFKYTIGIFLKSIYKKSFCILKHKTCKYFYKNESKSISVAQMLRQSPMDSTSTITHLSKQRRY